MLLAPPYALQSHTSQPGPVFPGGQATGSQIGGAGVEKFAIVETKVSPISKKVEFGVVEVTTTAVDNGVPAGVDWGKLKGVDITTDVSSGADVSDTNVVAAAVDRSTPCVTVTKCWVVVEPATPTGVDAIPPIVEVVNDADDSASVTPKSAVVLMLNCRSERDAASA